MAWDDEELRASVLEEFAMNMVDGDVWLEQAEAMRRYRLGQFARARRFAQAAREAVPAAKPNKAPKAPKPYGTCLDCYAPAVESKRRCERCLKRRTQNQMRYLHRGANDPLPPEAKQVIAQRAARRREGRG